MSGSKNWFDDYGTHPLQILKYSIFKQRIRYFIWYKEIYIGIKEVVRILWETPLQIFNYSIFKPLIIFIWYKNVYPGIKGCVRRLWEAPPANIQIFNIQTTGDL